MTLRKAILACFLLAAVACAPVLAPVPSVPVRTVALGLNDAFHGPLPPRQATIFCGTTIRTPQLSIEALRAYYASIAGCPAMRSIILVEAPDVALVHQLSPLLHPGDLIELGNELELAPYELSTSQFASFIHASCVPNAVTGGVYALTKDTEARLLAAHAACPSARLGLHLYQPLTLAQARWLADAPAHVLITESGFPTRCDPRRDPQQLAFLRNLRSVLSTLPTVDLLVIYQRPIGPTCSDFDTFGIEGHVAEKIFAE